MSTTTPVSRSPRAGAHLRRCLGLGAALALGLSAAAPAWAQAAVGEPVEPAAVATIAPAGKDNAPAPPSTTTGRPEHAGTNGPPAHSSSSSISQGTAPAPPGQATENTPPGQATTPPGQADQPPTAPVPPGQSTTPPGQTEPQPAPAPPGEPPAAPVPPGQAEPPAVPAPPGEDPGAPVTCTGAAGGDVECVDAAAPAPPGEDVPLGPTAALPAVVQRALDATPAGRALTALLAGAPAPHLLAPRAAAALVGDDLPGVVPAIAVVEGQASAAGSEADPQDLVLSAWAQGALAPLPVLAMVLTGLAAGALVVFLQSAPGLSRDRRRELHRRAMEIHSV